jgi:hypothetical protein
MDSYEHLKAHYQGIIKDKEGRVSKLDEEISALEAQIKGLQGQKAKEEADLIEVRKVQADVIRWKGDAAPAVTPAATASKAAKKATKKKATKKKATKKAAPKPVKKAKAAASTPAKKPSTSNVAAGRRAVAEGKRPSLSQAMVQVMGTDACKAAEVYKRLAEKGWAPESGNPTGYIAGQLSREADLFERVERGVYKAKRHAAASEPKKKAPKKTAKASAKKTAPKKTAKKRVKKAAKKTAKKAAAKKGGAPKNGASKSVDTPSSEPDTSKLDAPDMTAAEVNAELQSVGVGTDASNIF